MNFFELLDSGTMTIVPTEFYFKSFDESFEMHMHSHVNFEFMYAESGNFTVSVLENGEQTDYEVFEGGLIFIQTELPHKLVITKSVKICNLELMQTQMPVDCKIRICPTLNSFEIFQQMKKNAQNVLVLNDTENILTTMLKIHSILKVHYNEDERFYQLQALLLSLFIDIGKCYYNSKYNVDDLYVSKILRIINKNLAADLSARAIASKLKISESYLFRLFKKKINCTLTYYVNQIRIEKAKQLLAKTTHPIVNIGAEVGYNNRQYFCKVFSAFTGLSPQQFRKKLKKSEYTMALQGKAQTFWDEL